MPIRYLLYKRNGLLDLEMFLVDRLLNRRCYFIDVGANLGMYSYFYSRSFKEVVAFEPISEVTMDIEKFRGGNIIVHNIALSNVESELEFFIPVVRGELCPGLASLESRSLPSERRIVSVKTLDSFNFNNVDLIKIDVEGHEYSVIQGAEKTIKKYKPLLIVEIEQRHIAAPIEVVFDLILKMGYNGYYILDMSVHSVNQFDCELNQTRHLDNVNNPKYVNNFIFVPNEMNVNCEEMTKSLLSL